MSFEFFPAAALFYQERWSKVLRWWEGTTAFFCADCSLHNLLKMSTDTAFDLGVINHAVERGESCWPSSFSAAGPSRLLGLNNSVAAKHADHWSGMR